MAASSTSAPRRPWSRMTASASGTGTRTATPSAIVRRRRRLDRRARRARSRAIAGAPAAATATTRVAGRRALIQAPMPLTSEPLPSGTRMVSPRAPAASISSAMVPAPSAMAGCSAVLDEDPAGGGGKAAGGRLGGVEVVPLEAHLGAEAAHRLDLERVGAGRGEDGGGHAHGCARHGRGPGRNCRPRRRPGPARPSSPERDAAASWRRGP